MDSVGALRQLLREIDAAIEVRGAIDPADAIAVLDNEPDVSLVLLDLALPGARGLDFLGDLKLDYPGVPAVVLSATHDQATVTVALGADAHRFIPKTADAGLLLDAVRRVLDGGVCLMPDAAPMPEGDGVHSRPDALGLTARQTDMLKLLAQGKPNKLADSTEQKHGPCSGLCIQSPIFSPRQPYPSARCPTFT